MYINILGTSNIPVSTSNPPGLPYFSYRPRPGIVLDDTEYKPGLGNRQPIITRPPIGQIGEIFDITVSAIQGPGGNTAGQGKPYVIPGKSFIRKTISNLKIFRVCSNESISTEYNVCNFS